MRLGVILWKWDRANLETVARSLFGPDPANWNLSEVLRKALQRAALEAESRELAGRLTD